MIPMDVSKEEPENLVFVSGVRVRSVDGSSHKGGIF